MTKKIEISDSKLSENLKSSIEVLVKDLDNLAKTAEIGSVVRVVEKNLRPYILLDTDDGKAWFPYDGASAAVLNMMVDCEVEGKRKFDEEGRTPEELDQLRVGVTALATYIDVTSVKHMDRTEIGEIMMSDLLTAIAIRWYKTDKNVDIDPTQDNQPEDFPPYLVMAHWYIEKITNFFNQVKESTNVLVKEMQKEMEAAEGK